MGHRAAITVGATDIDAPTAPTTVALHAYWHSKRRGRCMPSRADIDPAEMKALLPYVFMHEADPDGTFRVRLVGQAIVEFLGVNRTGQPVTAGLTAEGAASLMSVLDAVRQGRQPRFQQGEVFWWREKEYRRFEACFLPLSADGRHVNIVLGALSFDA